MISTPVRGPTATERSGGLLTLASSLQVCSLTWKYARSEPDLLAKSMFCMFMHRWPPAHRLYEVNQLGADSTL